MKSANSPRMPAAGRPRSTPGSGRAASRRRTGATAKGPRRGGRPHARVARLPRPRRFTPPDPARIDAILGILERTYPDATTALDFQTPLQLLIATILSAQCTDARVNMVTPALFARYPDAAALAAAPQADVEAMIRSTGFYRNKARAIRECCADIVAKHHGEVPRTLEELTAAARRRAQDRERRARERLRRAGPGRRHARRAARSSGWACRARRTRSRSSSR